MSSILSVVDACDAKCHKRIKTTLGSIKRALDSDREEIEALKHVIATLKDKNQILNQIVDDSQDLISEIIDERNRYKNGYESVVIVFNKTRQLFRHERTERLKFEKLAKDAEERLINSAFGC